MQRAALVVVALTAILSASLAAAAPTDLVPVIAQLPQLPIPPITIPTANLDFNNLDDNARAQARALLDEVVSRYPTLIDNFASLLNTQSLLSSPSLLQNLRSSDLRQPVLPELQIPDLSAVLPNIPGLPSLPNLPSIPGLPDYGSLRSDATSPLSTAVDVVLANLRGFASSPLDFVPPRLTQPGSRPIGYTPGEGLSGLQLPKIMVPLVLTFPNEEGLSPEELAESIKKKIREQSPTTNDGSLNAMVSLDPLMLTRVVDVKPRPPLPKENTKKDSSNRPHGRRIVPNPLFGQTDVKIVWNDTDVEPGDKPADNRNVRLGM